MHRIEGVFQSISMNEKHHLLKRLISVLPDTFGKNATETSLKALIMEISTSTRIEVIPNGKGYKDHFTLQGKPLKKLGFPTDVVSIMVDEIESVAWSLYLKSEIKNTCKFSLTWSNKLSSHLRTQKKTSSQYLRIDYQLHHIPGKHFIYNLNEKEMKYMVDSRTRWNIGKDQLLFRMNLNENLVTLKFKSSIKEVGNIHLKIPISIKFVKKT